jgi:hypothetical protein
VIADPDVDEQTHADITACKRVRRGALTETEFRHALASAVFEKIEIRETHRVHERAAAAIIRARPVLKLIRARVPCSESGASRQRSPGDLLPGTAWPAR